MRTRTATIDQMIHQSNVWMKESETFCNTQIIEMIDRPSAYKVHSEILKTVYDCYNKCNGNDCVDFSRLSTVALLPRSAWIARQSATLADLLFSIDGLRSDRSGSIWRYCTVCNNWRIKWSIVQKRNMDRVLRDVSMPIVDAYYEIDWQQVVKSVVSHVGKRRHSIVDDLFL